MDPATMMLVATAVGTGMSAYGQYQYGKQQEQIGKQQARIAEQEGARKREIARETALEKRKEKRALLAKQIVLYAKSGVRAGVGTPSLVGKETESRLDREAQIIQEQGIYDWQYGKSQADIYRKQGAAAKESGMWGAAATLTTGFSNIAGMQYQFGKSGGKTLATAKKTSGWQWKTNPWSYGRNF